MDRFTELVEDEDKLVNPLTLVAGLIALSVVVVSINVGLNQLNPTWRLRQLPFDAAIIAFWVWYWSYRRYRLPKNETEQLGIVIALTTENDKEKTRVRFDVVRRFRDLLVADELQDYVNVIAFSNHQANQIIPILEKHAATTSAFKPLPPDVKNEKKWYRIKKSVRANVYIYGHVNERHEVQNKYFLSSNILVVHLPLTEEVRRQLTVDFASVWLLEVNFAENNEKPGFEFTSHYWLAAAQYAVGSAAFAYGDFWTALKLLEPVKSKIDIFRTSPNFPIIQKRLNQQLAMTHAVLAQSFRQNGETAKAIEQLNKCLNIDPQNYSGHLIKAIVEFSIEHNPQKALTTIQQLSRYAGKDRTWLYSQGFLLLYLERFEKGLIAYRRIAKSTYDGEETILAQVISFNEERLRIEPKKIQSHFILGYLKFKKAINYPEALEHLETFVKEAKALKYKPLVDEANECIRLLGKLMGMGSK